jgi:hypothetical protein
VGDKGCLDFSAIRNGSWVGGSRTGGWSTELVIWSLVGRLSRVYSHVVL